MYLLLNAHVATVAGQSFGSPNFIRISTAASDEALEEAIERIKKACAELK